MSRAIRPLRPDQPCPYWGHWGDVLAVPCEAGHDGHEPPCRVALPGGMMAPGEHAVRFVLHDLEGMWKQEHPIKVLGGWQSPPPAR